jgi:TonB family protein
MRRKFLLLLSFAMLGAAFAHAQDAASMFRDAILNQQVYLRNFDASVSIKGRWTNGVLEVPTPPARMVAAITVKAVNVKADSVEIVGTRQALLYEKNGQLSLFPVRDEVKIHIDFDKAFQGAALGDVLADLFFASREAALAAVPRGFAHEVPYRLIQATPEPGANSRDCADTTDAARTYPGDKSKGMAPPAIRTSVEPEYSAEAKQKKVSGDVLVALTIGTDGAPHDLWIVKPVGLGLDTNAVNAVRQYKFKPATCHGNPVLVQLTMDVNFKVF